MKAVLNLFITGLLKLKFLSVTRTESDGKIWKIDVTQLVDTFLLQTFILWIYII